MLVIIGILLFFGLVVRHKWRNGAAKKDEILRLVAVASEEEAEIAKLQAIDEYNSQPNPPLETHISCAVCYCPTTTRCSRCKAVKYCSGKCQIIHWRQGHKDDCQPAPASHAKKKSECVETAPGHQFAVHLNNEVKVCSDPSEEFDDSRSSNSSTSCFFSSTERSETSFDSSMSEDAELQTPIRRNRTPSVSIDSHISQTISESDDIYVPSASVPFNSVKPPLVNKIERTPASKSDENLKLASFNDEREGDGAAVIEKFVPGAIELGSPQSTSPVRTSSTEDLENQAHTSTSKVARSIPSKPFGSNELPNVELSSRYTKSSKTLPSHDHWKNEFCDTKETRPATTFRSSGSCQNLSTKTDSPQVISSEIEGDRIFSQSTSKGLKTSVRKLVQHFKAPKQSMSYAFDVVKDSGGNQTHKAVFPIKLFMQLYSCDDVALHPFGLVNCGNSCYANAVLQCLTFTRPITSYLLQRLHSETCWKRAPCFICKFERLIQKGQETNSPVSPVGLLSQIQPIGREEDAHEFLRNVVDKMQSTCLEEAGVSGSFAEDSTLMGLTFGGYLRSKIKCMKCSGRSERRDRMLDLTVEIDGNIHKLEEALTQFTKSETLGGDDKYKCNRCKSYEKAKKRLTILEAPNILTIVLKRFRSGNMEKLNKLVRFPEMLNLSPYLSGMSDEYPIYRLYAVVVHLGIMNTAYSGGHYVSYIKDFQGAWFRIDDSRVSRVDLETVLSVEAYILFYARETPRDTSFVRNSSVHSDGKTKRNMEAISSNNAKKKNPKTKTTSSGWNTESTSPHRGSNKHLDWMTPNDFTGVHLVDSDSSSIFSTSDAGSCSTDSTKDSSAEDISGYIFGSSSWYNL
ncbi:hypothetical protein ACS0TY_028802 [Phlomoides rotata]